MFQGTYLYMRVCGGCLRTLAFCVLVNQESERGLETGKELVSLYSNRLPPIYSSWKRICLTRAL